eukprot:scaffold14.g1093.t1
MFYAGRRHLRRRGWHVVDVLPEEAVAHPAKQPVSAHPAMQEAAVPTSSSAPLQQARHLEQLVQLTKQAQESVQQAASSAEAAAGGAHQHLSRVLADAAADLQLPEGVAATQQQLAQLPRLATDGLSSVQQAAADLQARAAAGLSASSSSGDALAHRLEQRLGTLRHVAAQLQQSPVPAELEQRLAVLRSLTAEQLANLRQAVAALRQAQEAQLHAATSSLQQRQQSRQQQRRASLQDASVAVEPVGAPTQLTAAAAPLPLLARWGGAVALVLCALAAAVGRVSASRRRSTLQQSIQEAEARARAAQRMERQRQRFQRALVAAEHFESSIDNSVFSAVSQRSSGPGPGAGPSSSAAPLSAGGESGTGARGAPSAAEAIVGAAAEVNNPFLRSMDGRRFSLDEQQEGESVASGAGAEGDDAAEAAEAESWDAETRRAWEAFVRGSKVGQGKMWDVSDVDEGLPEVYVDLNKE